MNEIIPVEAQQKAEETEVMVQSYDGYAIVSQKAYQFSAEDLKKIKAKANELDGLRKSLTKPLDESKKRIMEFFKKPLTLLSSAEQSIKSAMISWQQEQEKVRKAEEQRLADAQQKEADRLARLAAAAEKRGDDKKAEEFKGREAITKSVVPAVVNNVQPVAGIATRIVWKYRIVDVNQIPRQYMIPNETAIGQVARATKGSVKIEGIEIYSEETIAAGRV